MQCASFTSRIERGKQFVANLQKGGVAITWEEVLEQCKNCLPSRPRIAEVLVVEVCYSHSLVEARIRGYGRERV